MTCSKSEKMTYDLFKVNKMATVLFDLFKFSQMIILILNCSKSAKWLSSSKAGKWVLCFFDLFKVSKVTLLIMTCSELAVLKVKIDSISKNRIKKYMLIYLRKAVANREIHDTFLSLKKVIKNGIWKLWINIYLWLRKVSWVALFATSPKHLVVLMVPVIDRFHCTLLMGITYVIIDTYN